MILGVDGSLRVVAQATVRFAQCGIESRTAEVRIHARIPAKELDDVRVVQA
jgi:hypothetical protein